jgi:hypothetical protein
MSMSSLAAINGYHNTRRETVTANARAAHAEIGTDLAAEQARMQARLARAKRSLNGADFRAARNVVRHWLTVAPASRNSVRRILALYK